MNIKTVIFLTIFIFLVSIQTELCFSRTIDEMFGLKNGLKVWLPKTDSLTYDNDRVHLYLLQIKSEQLKEELKERQRLRMIQEQKENEIYQKHLGSRIVGSFSKDFLPIRYF